MITMDIVTLTLLNVITCLAFPKLLSLITTAKNKHTASAFDANLSQVRELTLEKTQSSHIGAIRQILTNQ